MRKVIAPLRRLVRQMQQFGRDRRGATAMLTALAALPLVFCVGAGVDFAGANMSKAKLDAVADAAALAAVDHTAITGTTDAAQTTAQNVFNAEAVNLANVTITSLNVTVSDNATQRSAVVSYSATRNNTFMGLLGIPTVTVTGQSSAAAGLSTNINFYMLLDNSPSMAIAATTAGINTMVAHTQSQGGCAFACHESHPSADNLGNPGGVDNYTLAQQLGVVTRIQNVATATQSLANTATAMEQPNNAQYQMALYTFNYNGLSTVQQLTSNLANAASSAQNIDVMEVYSNNYLTQSNHNNDTDTNFETAMSQINGIMPAPGTGAPSSTPREVLFIVSDGVDDEVASKCSATLDGNRCQQPFDTTWCTTVKNRGILIAVLYTVYLPLPTNSWYNQWIAPFQSQIGTNLEGCASPGLFYSVTTDGDITAAMQSLFAQAIATARLTH